MRDAELEALWRKVVWHGRWVVDENVVDDLAGDVGDAEAADAVAAFAGSLDEFDGFAVEGHGEAGCDEIQMGGRVTRRGREVV